MAKSNIKKIDPKIETPIKVVLGKTKGQDFGVITEKRQTVFDESKFNVSTLIFNFQKTCNRFGLKYDNVLVLLYLNELVVFNFDIKVVDRKIKLTEYKILGFIIEDFSAKSKTYYRLTESAKKIVSFFYASLKSNEEILSENKVLDCDATSALKSALNGYFSRSPA